MKRILFLVAIAIAVTLPIAAQVPAGSTNHGTVQGATQYSLPCYETAGTTRILGACLNIATDVNGNLIISSSGAAITQTEIADPGAPGALKGSLYWSSAYQRLMLYLHNVGPKAAGTWGCTTPGCIQVGGSTQLNGLNTEVTCAGNTSGTSVFDEDASGNCGWLSNATTVNGQSCALGSTCTIPLSAVNPQTGTYQVLAADFSNYKTITVASGTFTITLVASGSQPAAGQFINVINYGSGVVTIARSGQNINGGTASLTLPAATATAPSQAFIESDGTNYFANVSGFIGANSWCNDTGGSASTYICAPNAAIPATPSDGTLIEMKAAHASNGVATIAVSGAAAISLQRMTQAGLAALGTNDIVLNMSYVIRYDATAAVWVLVNSSATAQVSGAMTQYDVVYGNTGNAHAVTNNIKVDSTNKEMFATYKSLSTTGIGVGGIFASTGAVTIGSGSSIGATSLCSTTQCPAGRYEVTVYIEITTACTTTGSTIPWLGFTDDAGAKAGSSTTTYFSAGGGLGVTPATSAAGLILVPISTTDFLTGHFFLNTTGAATGGLGAINYGITNTACGSGGPMVGKAFFDVTRLE